MYNLARFVFLIVLLFSGLNIIPTQSFARDQNKSSKKSFLKQRSSRVYLTHKSKVHERAGTLGRNAWSIGDASKEQAFELVYDNVISMTQELTIV